MTSIPILKTDSLSKELKLQLKLLLIKDARLIDSHWFSDIDWNEFYDLLLHHRTFSFLYGKLKDQPHVPQKIKQRLERMYKHFTFEMLHLTREMTTIHTMFQRQGIHTLFLKGPVLAKDLYGDLSLRTSSDLDVLVPIEELEHVHTLLAQDGYVKDDYIRSVLGDWKWRHHHVAYHHPVKNIKLEVHWRLNPGPWKEPSFQELWTRKEACLFANEPLYRLGNEDLFLFLLSHGARHGWSRARWLLDIAFLVDKEMNFHFLKRLFKRYHADQLAGQALHLLHSLFNKSIRPELQSYLTNKHGKELAQQTLFYYQNKINLHSDPVPDWVSRYHDHYLFQIKNPQQKLLFMLSFLYPYPEDQDVLSLPKHFHFLYFPLRPLLLVWKKMRKQVESTQ
ncbi:nucleotidyltransferase family protein [Bacillus sp. E(2018)]|uniref:nucleotidyltransferase domain-containing protein n=1 Tax=Bacillus sp. E(2018) TaxID=2502239 RepID=UPI0010F6D773|nr:nucleotidyltransferase family protein [Bacillus sp. E(2018)]